MASKKALEVPLTLSRFVDFYERTIEPRFRVIIEEELREFRNEVNNRFDDLYKKFETLRR